MSCQNMRIQDWSPEQLEKGVVQLHVQRLFAKNGRLRHGESATIHTTDREGLFDAASLAIVKLGVVEGRPATIPAITVIDPDRKRRVKT